MSDLRQPASALRQKAEAQAAVFPALLARARHLAASLNVGLHGRRRSGAGEEFWQYRDAMAGDNFRDIDWRKSARGDGTFIRQMEWQSAQSVRFWVDRSGAMNFASAGQDQKSDHARILALATMCLLSQNGERFGMIDDPAPPKTGEGHLQRIARDLLGDQHESEYGEVPKTELRTGSRAVFISDFLGDYSRIIDQLSAAADQNVEGCLIQILDPVEVEFPYSGRKIFQSVTGAIEFETMRANALREKYLDRLATRQDDLRKLCRNTGWEMHIHRTDRALFHTLAWLYAHLEGR